jgi:hypothetical protein
LERGATISVAEFGNMVDMDRVLAGSPWITSKHAVTLKDYDEPFRIALLGPLSTYVSVTDRRNN